MNWTFRKPAKGRRVWHALILLSLTIFTFTSTAGEPLRQDYGQLGERILYPDTSMHEAAIVAPDNLTDTADALAAALAARTASEIPVLSAAGSGVPDDLFRRKNLILFGTFGANPLIDVLYGMRLTPVDGYLPGSEGYLLHTIADPFGYGRNVIVIGCADAAGAEAAVETLLDMLDPGASHLPFLLEANTAVEPHRLARAAIDRVEAHLESLRTEDTAEGGIFEALRDIQRLGEGYAFFGDKEMGEALVRLLPAFAEVVNEMDGIPPGRLHGWSPLLHSVWRLLEPSPLFAEQERAAIAHCYAQLVEWDMNESYVAAFTENYEAGELPELRRNKYIFSSFGIFLGYEYFSTYFPDFPELTRWKDLVDTMFGKAESIMCKDDATDYFFHVPVTFLRYAAAAGDERILNEAVRMARLLTMFVDSLGSNTQVGDGTSFGHASALYWGHSALLRAAAHYTGDPFFLGVLEKVKHNQVGASTRDLDNPLFMFTTPMGGRLPDGPAGIEIFPLDEAYYRDILNPHSRMYHIGHPRSGELNVPPEKGFFKMVWREGWGEEDQYMMLNGVNGAIHEHSDGNTINSLVDRGRIWLSDRSYSEKSENFHNGVVVARDGRPAGKPYLAALELKADLPRTAVTRTTNRDYNGTDWERTIFWSKGRYFLVRDEVSYREPGEYVVQNYWHVIGACELAGNRLVARQKDRSFALINLNGSTQRMENRRDYATTMWGQYPFFQDGEGPNVSKLRQVQAGNRSDGDRDVFMNLLVAADAEAAPDIHARRVDSDVFMVKESGQVDFIGAGEYEREGFSVVGDAFALSEETILVAGLQSLRIGQTRIETEAAGLSVEIDVSTGRVEVAGGEEKDLRVSLEDNFPDEYRELFSRWVTSADISDEVAALQEEPRVTSSVELETIPFATGESSLRAMLAIPPEVGGETMISVGDQAGNLRAYARDGRILWEKNLGAAINDLVLFSRDGVPVVAVACTGYSVRAVGLDGRLQWTRTVPEPRRTPESLVGVTTLAVGRGSDGNDELWAGTAYLDVYRIDGDGEVLWRGEGYHRGVNALALGDFSGDGRDQAVIGLEWRNVQWETNGRFENLSRSTGWNWTVAQTQKLDEALPPAVFAGSADGWLERLSPAGGPTWSVRLAGGVRDIALRRGDEDDNGSVIAGTGGFYLYAFSTADGRRLWQNQMSDRIERIVSLPDGTILVLAFDGRITHHAKTGNVLGEAILPEGAVDLILLPGEAAAIAGSSDGSLWDIHGWPK